MKLFFKLPLLALFTVLTFSSCSTDSIDDKADAMELSLFSQEAKRLIKEGPTWKPAIHNGENISDELKITIVFEK